jgi:sigma-B regulation protein RsbU (phosphoserine phosphatase)
MGRIRSALRAYALETCDPAEVLAKLDAKIQHFEPRALATVAYAVFDPGLEEMHICLAGHYPRSSPPRGGPASWPTFRPAY